MILHKTLHYITIIIILSTVLTVISNRAHAEENSPFLNKLSKLYKENQTERALEMLNNEQTFPPPLKDLLTVLKAQLYINLKKTTTAASILRKFVDVSKLKESGQPKASILLANLEYTLKNYDKAAFLVENILNSYKEHRNRYELKHLLARSLDLSGKKNKAFAAYLDLAESTLQKEPARRAFKTLLKWFVNDLFPTTLDLNDKLRWGHLLLRKREYTRVLDVVTPLINSLKNGNYSKSEEYKIFILGGKTEMARGNGWWAGHLFKKATSVAPDRQKAAESIALAGDAMYRIAQYVRAEKHYKKVLSSYKDLPQAAKACYGLANIYQKNKQSNKAIVQFKTILKNWPDSWFAGKVAWELAIEEYSRKKFRLAADSFKTFIKISPQDRLATAATYWLAKSLSHLSSPWATRQALKSVLQFPVPGIYHLSASCYMKLKGSSLPKGLPLKDFNKRRYHIDGLNSLVPPRPRDGWAPLEEATISDLERERLTLLKSYKMFTLLSEELQRLVENNRGNFLLRNNLAWACEKNHDYPGAIEQGEIMLASTAPFEKISKALLFDKLFPIPERLPFVKYSKEFKVEPFVTYSIAREESHFDEGLISWAGAKGLMQVMNPTGEWIAPKIGIKKFSPELLYKPSVNVKAGCWYLNYLSEKFSSYESANSSCSRSLQRRTRKHGQMDSSERAANWLPWGVY